MFNSTTSQSLFCYNIFNVLIYYYVVQGIINNSRIKYLSNYIVSFFHNILSFVFYLSIPSIPVISNELDKISKEVENRLPSGSSRLGIEILIALDKSI